MTRDEYDAIDAVNWSTLRHLRRSPLHYRHALQAPREDTDTLRVGRAVHTATLEPDRFALEYVVWTGGRRYGREWDEFQRVHEGRTILTVAQYDRACRIRDAVHRHPMAAALLTDTGGRPEHTLVWDDLHGIRGKGRLDWFNANEPLIVDLKTARNAADARWFARDAWTLGYHHQLSWYARGLGRRTKYDALLIAVEPEQPHDVVVYEPDDDSMALAGDEIDTLVKRLAECRAADKWPGVAPLAERVSLSAPRWAFPDLDDQEIADPDWLSGGEEVA